jgi:DNA polymerase/3'-5' exonuclease PolX
MGRFYKGMVLALLELVSAQDMNSTNSDVATRLDEIAQILEQQQANAFRIEAYRRAANMLRELTEPIQDVIKKEGVEGLQKLPGVGETLARLIHQLVITGRSPMLERLRGESDPIALLTTVPGIGKRMAECIHDELGIETLEELEIAAHDGRLAALKGFGEKRISGIRDSLASRLGKIRRWVVQPRKLRSHL